MALVLLLVGFEPRAAAPVPGGRTLPQPPNFVVIVTDDQSIHMLGLMPNVRALRERGFAFERAFVSNPVCCPSRATILTGLYSHSTGVYSNADGGGLQQTYGGWGAFTTEGLDATGQRTIDNEDRAIEVFLEEHGYDTALFGKYLNHYGHRNGSDVPPIPPGWETWRSFDGSNGGYYHYWIRNQAGVRYVPRTYSTDFFGGRARAWLRSDAASPFFLYFAPFAPHGPSTPAPQDRAVTAPTSFRTPAFNEADVSDKPPYIRRLPFVDPAEMRTNYDRAFASLVDVDRWIGRFVRTLRDTGRLGNTVFLFLSDNGTTHGDHRWGGKFVPYERGIRVPFLMAGPGIRSGSSLKLVANVDIAPTLLGLAGLLDPDGTYTDIGGGIHRFDGASLVPTLTGNPAYVPHPDPAAPGGQSILLEGLSTRRLPSFCGLRTPRWKFVVYRRGFRELYDLRRDPYELNNVAELRPSVSARMFADLRARCSPAPPDFLPWNRL